MRQIKAVLLVVVAVAGLAAAILILRSSRGSANDSDVVTHTSSHAGEADQESEATTKGEGASGGSTTVSGIDDLSNRRFYDSGVESELSHLNPQKGAWETEVISQQVQSQLEELGHMVTDAGANHVEPDRLSSFLGNDFQCEELRPDSLSKAFDDGRTEVWRSGQATSDSSSHFKGTGGLKRALTALLPEWGPAKDASIHFHVIKVQAEDPRSATTKATFRLTARTGKDRIQQNAIWTCQWKREGSESKPVLSQIKVSGFEEVVVQNVGDSAFADCTESVFKGVACYKNQLVYGIDHWRRRIDKRFGLEIIGSHGLALGDVNGDGLDDVFMAESGGLPNRLFLHEKDGTLKDISAKAGVNFLEPAHSALFVDLDNDGDQDLVMASGRYVVFLENDGTGRFAKKAIHQTDSVLRSMVANDYDLDGDLDLYVCGYYSRMSDSTGLGRPMPYHDANNGAPNLLLRNNGNWRFEDATSRAGLNENNSRFSYAAAWGDYDDDGDQDLYVANDYGRNNLYRNNDGEFEDVAAKTGVEDIAAGMSVSWGDYNLDGRLDLYVGNMFSSAGNRVAYQRRYRQEHKKSRSHYQRHARGNTLFRNAGEGTFADVSLQAGVTRGRWAWSSIFADLNNDGWQDLVVGNGFVTSRRTSADL